MYNYYRIVFNFTDGNTVWHAVRAKSMAHAKKAAARLAKGFAAYQMPESWAVSRPEVAA